MELQVMRDVLDSPNQAAASATFLIAYVPGVL